MGTCLTEADCKDPQAEGSAQVDVGDRSVQVATAVGLVSEAATCGSVQVATAALFPSTGGGSAHTDGSSW